MPKLEAGEDAIQTAIRELRFTWHKSPKNGFSEDPRVIRERLVFAEIAIKWTNEQI